MKSGRKAYQRNYKKKQRQKAKANGLCAICCSLPATRPQIACKPGEKAIVTCKACVHYAATRRSVHRQNELSNRVGQGAIARSEDSDNPGVFANSRNVESIASTEMRILLLARLGQQKFKKALKVFWKSQCCVTGSPFVPLLRASHIKPWAVSTPSERLDVHNGLLLLPHLDALFDCGFISFRNDGLILISSRLPESERDRLNLSRRFRLIRVVPEHIPYLDYHRTMVFEKPRRYWRNKGGDLIAQSDNRDVAA